MHRNFLLFLFLGWTLSGFSQDFSLKVWPDGPPNTNNLDRPEEQYDGRRVRNVSEAEMYVYLPEEEINTEAAVLICPGGGYVIEAMEHEGYAIAEWLKEKGIAGIVLKYRLPYGHDCVPSSDARQAMRIIRQHAEEWHIHPGKVGIAGSSAGGHLASTVGTRFDRGSKDAADLLKRFSCRPDFMLLLYPVISFREDLGHMGSRVNLIGETNNWEHARQYSNELHVSRDTPPAFLVLADNDRSVDPLNSVYFYLEMKKHAIPAELHIFQEGGHGFGLRTNHIPADNWPDLFHDWLKAIKMIDP
jgi:acetyl esterase/lipase